MGEWCTEEIKLDPWPRSTEHAPDGCTRYNHVLYHQGSCCFRLLTWNANYCMSDLASDVSPDNAIRSLIAPLCLAVSTTATSYLTSSIEPETKMRLYMPVRYLDLLRPEIQVVICKNVTHLGLRPSYFIHYSRSYFQSLYRRLVVHRHLFNTSASFLLETTTAS